MTHSIRPQQPDRSELFVVPLRNSEDLMRSPAYGTKGSKTGAFVDPATNMIILTESAIEKKAVRTFLADRRVKSVKEQALTVPYLGEDGEILHHTIDLLVTLEDGTRIGLVIKPESSAIKHDLRALVERMAKATSRSKADRLQMLTDRQLPEWSSLNADILVKVRRDRRTHIDDELRDLAPKLTSPIRIGDLSEHLGGGHLAFRPIIRAIYYGTLVYLGLGRIDENSSVRFSGQVMEDTGRHGPEVIKSLQVPPDVRRRLKDPKPRRRASVRHK